MWKVTIALFVTLLISSLQKAQGEAPPSIGDGHCIWYDTCDLNPEKIGADQYLNCKYDGESKNLTDDSAITKLTISCPELVADIIDDYGYITTCCSPDNIDIMSEQLTQLNGILYRCPACISNLRKSFCYFACHPRHSAFLVPTSYQTNSTTNMESVLTVTEYITTNYTYDTYDSCSKVYYPELGTEALTLLCGPWGVENCSPERLFDYFGNNEFAPFNISYVYANDNQTVIDADGNSCYIDPFNVEVIPCSTNDSSLHCLCSDCTMSCPPPPEPLPPPDYIMVGDVRLYVFLIILFYTIFFVVTLSLVCCYGLPGNTPYESDCCTCSQKTTAAIENKLENGFQCFAKGVASNPIIVLMIGAAVIIALSFGIKQIQMTTDPVELWAAPDSRSRLEKDYYDQNFGPFYRTNQIIITSIGVEGFNYSKPDPTTGIDIPYSFGPVFNDSFMLEALDLQLQIMNLTAEYNGQNVTLNDTCIMPLAPQNDVCMIQSVMNYWQNNPDTILSMMTPEDPFHYADYLLKCVSNPTYIGPGNEDCLASYGGPVLPYVALGGFLAEGQSLSDNPHYEESTALVMTFLGQNYQDKSLLGPALAWEEVFLNFMKNYSNPFMDIAFNAERGIEDEIIREGKSDISTIFISYFVMFAYVTLSLGSFSCQCSRICIETKLLLGLSSVCLVLLAVVSSVGLCGYAGVEGTLFVIEVIPFLVLAVGVDNIFLLVQTWQREAKLENESVEDHIARVVGRVGPSMLLATSSEVVCFFLGALSKMPAVHAFSLYAGVALSFDFLLQITCLVALITLDAKRYASNRYDVFCCIKGEKENKQEASNTDICLQFFEKVYAPFILGDVMRTLIILVFVGAFCTSSIYVPRLDVGLEQDIGMPDDSFVLKYFDFLGKYLSVGPPVYFVMDEGYNFPIINEQNLICSSSGCNDDSALTQVFVSSLSPNVTYIATGAASWLDSYFSWISDSGAGSYPLACCRLDENGDFVDTSEQWSLDARSLCLNPEDFVTGTQRPKPEYFMEFLPDFLIDNPHDKYCPQAGHPAYGTAVNILEADNVTYETSANISGESNVANATTYVGANYYMAYHTILKTSADFTNALDRAYSLTDQLSEYIQSNSMTPDVKFFPYSIFYVYYEQYLSMWATVGASLAISFAAVFVVMFLLTGFDFRSSIINLIIIIMIIVNLMGFMYCWNIQLNAISLVNIVMACGISVEFCSHVTRAFALTSKGTKVERATRALAYTGSSVLAGITMTKFGGIIVLAFANSQVINVFYFRMYLLIVGLGAAHGLVFLPVLLSLIGPPINPYNKTADTKGKSLM